LDRKSRQATLDIRQVGGLSRPPAEGKRRLREEKAILTSPSGRTGGVGGTGEKRHEGFKKTEPCHGGEKSIKST